MPRPAAARGEGRGADGGERENRHAPRPHGRPTMFMYSHRPLLPAAGWLLLHGCWLTGHRC
jgi:hypothetical protein